MSRPKPLVQVACLCEKVLIEPDNVPSVIRIVDVYTIHAPTHALPEGVAAGVELTAFISLKSGEIVGEHEIELRLRNPEGAPSTARKWPVVFNGGQHGAIMKIDFRFGSPKTG